MQFGKRHIFLCILAISLLFFNIKSSFAGVLQTSAQPFSLSLYKYESIGFDASPGTTFASMSITVTDAYDASSAALFKTVNGTRSFVMYLPEGTYSVDISGASHVEINTSHYVKGFGTIYTQYYAPTSDDVQATTDAANTAATNALNAMNAANSANTAAQQAKSSADAANNNANIAKQYSWYDGAYGGPSESVGNLAGYIRNTQLPGLETKINNLQTTVTNIQNQDILPPTVDVQTVSGARATSASSIPSIVTVTDNCPGPFTYSINGGAYSSLPDDGLISLPVANHGTNSITVNVKDAAGNVGKKTIIIRRL